jgi:hypothetical protein
MMNEQVVEFVGGSDEEVAHLRLLLRRAAPQLRRRWRTRREGDSHVELFIVVDGEAALEGGARQVRLLGPAVGPSGIKIERWPLKVPQIVDLLNGGEPVAASPAPPATAAPAIQHNIYDDLFEAEAAAGDWSAGEPDLIARELALMDEAEAFFRHDSRVAHREQLSAMRLGDAAVDATEGLTAATSSRQQRRDPLALSETAAGDREDARLPLTEFLTGSWLAGPSRLSTAGFELTLDPLRRQYFANASLCVLEDCCRQPIARSAWRILTTTEFASIRQRNSARPYVELQWLCAYLDEQTLHSHPMQDGAAYRLREPLDLQRDYFRAGRVSRELIRGARLADIASTTRVALDDVRRIAAAFAAVGLLAPLGTH